ncbi:MAG: hypothetical protein JST45_12940 [Bacteroidetes bacterium]|nr:hypothetical protein [Bacteroidota bacterium]
MAQVTGPPPLIPSRAEHLRQREGNSEVLLDKDLIKRITEIQQLSEADRQGIFFALDGLLRDAKARKAYA